MGIIALSDQIINIFKSGYTEAILPLRIIIAALPFVFLNFPIGSALNACDKQKTNTRIMAIGLFFSIFLNILLGQNKEFHHIIFTLE